MLNFRRFWRSLPLPNLLKRFFLPLLLIGLVMPLVTVLIGANGLPVRAQQQTAPANRSEIRGVWMTNVDSTVLFDRTRLNNAVQELAQLNINTLYPVVWNWGYTTYPSTAAQVALGANVDPRPFSLEGRDALAEIIQAGHQRGMAVIPWFEFGFMTPSDSALAMRHPDWLTKRQDNVTTDACKCSSDDPYVWMEGIHPRVWLNPFKPEVQQFILNMILELVTRYDVDGIQFDDHFGLPVEFGYDPYTLQLYRQANPGKPFPPTPTDPTWMRWRADRMTDFLKRVFQEIKSRKQQVIISLSPNNYSFSYNHSLQDWRTWERLGLIEELILQVYRDSSTAFLNELNMPEVQAARRHIPTAVGVLTGLKRRSVPIKQVQEQVQLIRNQNFAGVSFFFYETMWNLTAEPTNTRKTGFKAIFPTAAVRPNVTKGWRPV